MSDLKIVSELPSVSTLSSEDRVELALATITQNSTVLGVSSLQVSDKFGKRHDNVVRDVKALISTVDAEFSLLNFEGSTYVDDRGKTQSAYILTETGFSWPSKAFQAAFLNERVDMIKKFFS